MFYQVKFVKWSPLKSTGSRQNGFKFSGLSFVLKIGLSVARNIVLSVV